MIRRLHTLAACAAALYGTVCSADSLPLTDDSFINGRSPDYAYGETQYPLEVHNWGPKAALLRFDASSLPSDIADATLVLELRELKAEGMIDVHAITSDWNESSVTSNAHPTIEATPFTSLGVTQARVGNTISVDVTSAVERWADGSLPAFGFLLQTSEPIRAVFGTKEAGSPSTLDVTSGSAPGKPEVLDFSSTLPVRIEQPGMYVLDRDWAVGTRAGSNGTTLEISADNVTVDFRGFTLAADQTGGQTVNITGRNATLRNGSVTTGLYSFAIRSDARGTVIDDMYVLSDQGLPLEGDELVIRDTEYTGRGGITADGDSALITHSDLDCEVTCITIAGTGTRVLNNRIDVFYGNGVTVDGSNNAITDNLFDHRFADSVTSIEVRGNYNQLTGNTFMQGGTSNSVVAFVEVGGTANTIDGNVGAPPANGSMASYGIRFTADGNYYGDNRLAATVPYELGGTVQTDWGGNVGY